MMVCDFFAVRAPWDGKGVWVGACAGGWVGGRDGARHVNTKISLKRTENAILVFCFKMPQYDGSSCVMQQKTPDLSGPFPATTQNRIKIMHA